jgi:hypothetical protein
MTEAESFLKPAIEIVALLGPPLVLFVFELWKKRGKEFCRYSMGAIAGGIFFEALGESIFSPLISIAEAWLEFVGNALAVVVGAKLGDVIAGSGDSVMAITLWYSGVVVGAWVMWKGDHPGELRMSIDTKMTDGCSKQ